MRDVSRLHGALAKRSGSECRAHRTVSGRWAGAGHKSHAAGGASHGSGGLSAGHLVPRGGPRLQAGERALPCRHGCVGSTGGHFHAGDRQGVSAPRTDSAAQGRHDVAGRGPRPALQRNVLLLRGAGDCAVPTAPVTRTAMRTRPDPCLRRPLGAPFPERSTAPQPPIATGLGHRPPSSHPPRRSSMSLVAPRSRSSSLIDVWPS